MKPRTRKPGARLAFALAGLGICALPRTAPAQQPEPPPPTAQSASLDDLETRLRRLEELNAKLEQQNQKLAEQNDKLEKQNQQIQNVAPAAADAAPADPAAPPTLVKPDEVKKLVDGYLKEKDDKKAGDAKKKAEEEANGYEVGSDLAFKTVWKDGFVAETANKDFRVHLGGRFQEDFGWFAPTNAVNAALPGGFNDGADMRRARLRMDGTLYEVIDFVLEYEFAATTSTVLTAAGPSTVTTTLPGGGSIGATGNGTFSAVAPTDVYFDVTHLPGENRVRLGHFKEPFSLEDYGTSDSFLSFLERSTVTDSFSPNRNFGAMLWNDPFEQRVVYAVGAFKENSNNSFSTAFDYSNGSYAYTGRVGFNPWYENEGRCVLFLGGAYSYRTLDPTSALNRYGFANRIPIRVGSPTIISTGTFSATDTQLFNAQGALVYGPFSLQSEFYAAQGENVVRGAIAPGVPRTTRPDLDGFYVQATYFLTGENRVYLRDIGGFGRVRPLEPFYFVSRGGCGALGSIFGRGAWELTGRYEDVNDRSGAFNAFPAIAGVPGSAVAAVATAGEERDVTLGLNWYLNPNVKIQGNYVHALRDVANPFLSGDVDAFALRFALDF